ncbi:MAG TPA: flagellar brake protein [Gammaproteobacteria bacterium]|nr:flagellar brake protein [Gammaproteobacteria bacterium]
MSVTETTIDTLLGTDKGVRIEPGTAVQIEIDGVATRLQSTVVGISPGRFLIVTLPNSNVSIQSKLYRGNAVVLRYLYEGSAIAFQSTLLAATSEPAKLLFLGCPKVVAERSLRAEHRIDCRLPARLSANDQECPAIVLDLSMTGVNCVLRPAGDCPSTPARDAAVMLHLQLPGYGGELPLQGTVRGSGEDRDPAGIGIEFGELSSEAAQALRQYLDAVA